MSYLEAKCRWVYPALFAMCLVPESMRWLSPRQDTRPGLRWRCALWIVHGMWRGQSPSGTLSLLQMPAAPGGQGMAMDHKRLVKA